MMFWPSSNRTNRDCLIAEADAAFGVGGCFILIVEFMDEPLSMIRFISSARSGAIFYVGVVICLWFNNGNEFWLLFFLRRYSKRRALLAAGWFLLSLDVNSLDTRLLMVK